MRFNNPFELSWQINALDLIMLVSSLFILVYSVRQYRTGRPTYLVLWLGCICYGLIMEATTGMLISRSYIQGEFAVMIETKRLLGYDTDMPLYVPTAFYPVIIFLAFKLIESFGIRSTLARALSAGVFTVLIDAPYMLNGTLPSVRWWDWIDWQIAGYHVFEYWYGWPIGDALWELTWPPLMMLMVWRWERRCAATINDVAKTKQRPWRTLVATPIALGLLMNTIGLLFSFPTVIAMLLDVPQYPFIIGIGGVSATLLLYSAKHPVALDRAGWTLLAIDIIGYGAVTLAGFALTPRPAGQITISLVALVILVVLAAYPAHAARRRAATTGSVTGEHGLIAARHPDIFERT